MKNHTIDSIQELKAQKQPITVLTAYDASFSKLISEQGIEIILIGDSLGTVCQGHSTTVPVTMQQMIYHTESVNRGNQGAFLITDLPYMSYATDTQALTNAANLMQAGANMVKLEGGQWLLNSVKKLVERGIPVCAHLGLTPQSVNALSGYKVQGRQEEQARQMLDDAKALEQAGVRLLVLECVPTALAKSISETLSIPVIGIGAGPHTDGQVLVLHDMLGINPDFKPKFVKNFMAEQSVHQVADAIKLYIDSVKNRTFPAQEHSFN